MTVLSHCKILFQIDKNHWLSSLIAISSGLCSTFFTYQNDGSYVQNSYITSLKKELIYNFFIDPDFVSDRLILGLTDPLLQEYKDMSAQVSAAESRANIKEFITRAITNNLYKASKWGNLGYLAYRCAQRTIAASDAAQLYLSLQVISSQISDLCGGMYSASYYNAPLQKYEKLIALSKKFDNYRKPVEQLPTPQKITVDNVSFSYPGSDKLALSEISLEIFRGLIIALVGENGSGKTTLAKLIVGLYLPHHGNIFWDEINIKDVDLQALYKHIAIISQDPAQWPLTLENNILIGKPYQYDKIPHEWLKAIIESGTDEVIDSLPDKEKTLLTNSYPQGQDLSCGQWQRIAIARALYRDADIIIADEPTSALDAKAEAKIFAGIQKSFGQKTSREKIGIIITHRLANIASVDRIIVLDNGKIVEQGTHSELTRYP